VNAELKPYQLSDCYQQTEGRVYMTGTQALVRILLNQSSRDKAAGLNTGGFVSGYRGSPLGGVDLELWREKQRIADAGIEFLPAVNEDLAATMDAFLHLCHTSQMLLSWPGSCQRSTLQALQSIWSLVSMVTPCRVFPVCG